MCPPSRVCFVFVCILNPGRGVRTVPPPPPPTGETAHRLNPELVGKPSTATPNTDTRKRFALKRKGHVPKKRAWARSRNGVLRE